MTERMPTRDNQIGNSGNPNREPNLSDYEKQKITQQQQLEIYKIGRGLDTPEWFLKIIQAELADEDHGRYKNYDVNKQEPSKKAMYYGLRNIYTGVIVEPCIICMFLLKLLGEKPTPCLPVSECCSCMRIKPDSFRGHLTYILNGNPRAYYFIPTRGFEFSNALERPISQDPAINSLLQHKYFPDMVPPIQPIQLVTPNTGNICQLYNTETWSKDDWLTIVLLQITGDRPLADNFLRLLAVFPDSMSIEPIVEHRLQPQGGLKFIKTHFKKQRLQFPQFPKVNASETIVVREDCGTKLEIQLPHFYHYSQFTENKPIFEVYNEAILLLQERGPNADINIRPTFSPRELDFVRKYCPQISNSLHNHFIFQKASSKLPMTFSQMARFVTFASLVRCMWEGLRRTTPHQFWMQYVGTLPIPDNTIPSNGDIERKFTYATNTDAPISPSQHRLFFYALVDQCPGGIPGKGSITIWKPTEQEENIESNARITEEEDAAQRRQSEQPQEENTRTRQIQHEEDNEVSKAYKDETNKIQLSIPWYDSINSLSNEERIIIEASLVDLQARGIRSRLGYAETNEVQYQPTPEKTSWAEATQRSIKEETQEKRHQNIDNKRTQKEYSSSLHQNQTTTNDLRHWDTNSTLQEGIQHETEPYFGIENEIWQPTQQEVTKIQISNTQRIYDILLRPEYPTKAKSDNAKEWLINTINEYPDINFGLTISHDEEPTHSQIRIACKLVSKKRNNYYEEQPEQDTQEEREEEWRNLCNLVVDQPEENKDEDYIQIQEYRRTRRRNKKKTVPVYRTNVVTVSERKERILVHFQTEKKFATMEEWFKYIKATSPYCIEFLSEVWTSGEPTEQQIEEMYKQMWNTPGWDIINQDDWRLRWLMQNYQTWGESNTIQDWLTDTLAENKNIDFSTILHYYGDPIDKTIHNILVSINRHYHVEDSKRGYYYHKAKIQRERKNVNDFPLEYVDYIMTNFPTQNEANTLEEWLRNTIDENAHIRFPYTYNHNEEITRSMIDIACQVYVTGKPFLTEIEFLEENNTTQNYDHCSIQSYSAEAEQKRRERIREIWRTHPKQRVVYINRERWIQKIQNHFKTGTKTAQETMEHWIQDVMKARPDIDFTPIEYNKGEPTDEQILDVCKLLWITVTTNTGAVTEEEENLEALLELYETEEESKSISEWFTNTVKENTDIYLTYLEYEGEQPTEDDIQELATCITKCNLKNYTGEKYENRLARIRKRRKNNSDFTSKFVDKILTTYPTRNQPKTLEKWLDYIHKQHRHVRFPYTYVKGREIQLEMVNTACQVYVTGMAFQTREEYNKSLERTYTIHHPTKLDEEHKKDMMRKLHQRAEDHMEKLRSGDDTSENIQKENHQNEPTEEDEQILIDMMERLKQRAAQHQQARIQHIQEHHEQETKQATSLNNEQEKSPTYSSPEHLRPAITLTGEQFLNRTLHTWDKYQVINETKDNKEYQQMSNNMSYAEATKSQGLRKEEEKAEQEAEEAQTATKNEESTKNKDNANDDQEAYFYEHITQYCSNVMEHLCPEARLSNSKHHILYKRTMTRTRLRISFLHRLMNHLSDKSQLQFKTKFHVKSTEDRYVKNIYVCINTKHQAADLNQILIKQGGFQIVIHGLSDLYDLWKEYTTTAQEMYYEEYIQIQDMTIYDGEYCKNRNHQVLKEAWKTRMPKLERLKAINKDENHGFLFTITAEEITEYRKNPCQTAKESLKLYEDPVLSDMHVTSPQDTKYFMDCTHLASIMFEKTCPPKDTYKLDIPRFKTLDEIVYDHLELKFYESVSKHCSNTASELIQSTQLSNSKQLIPFQQKDCVRLTHRFLHTIMNHEHQKKDLLYEKKVLIKTKHTYVADIYVHILPQTTNIECLTQIRMGTDGFQIIISSILDMHTLWNAYRYSASRMYMGLNIKTNWRQSTEDTCQYIPSQHYLTNAWKQTRVPNEMIMAIDSEPQMDYTMYQHKPHNIEAKDIQEHRKTPPTDFYTTNEVENHPNYVRCRRERNFLIGQIHTAHTLMWTLQKQKHQKKNTEESRTTNKHVASDEAIKAERIYHELRDEENYHQKRFFNAIMSRCMNVNDHLHIPSAMGHIKKTPLTLQFLHKLVSHDIKKEDLINSQEIHIPDNMDRKVNNAQIYYDDRYQDGNFSQLNIKEKGYGFQLEIPDPAVLHQLWHEYFTTTQEFIYHNGIMPSQFVPQRKYKNPHRKHQEPWDEHRTTQSEIAQMLKNMEIEKVSKIHHRTMENTYKTIQLRMNPEKTPASLITEGDLLKRRQIKLEKLDFTNINENSKDLPRQEHETRQNINILQETNKEEGERATKIATILWINRDHAEDGFVFNIPKQQKLEIKEEIKCQKQEQESQEEEKENTPRYNYQPEEPNYTAAKMSLRRIQDFLISDKRNIKYTRKPSVPDPYLDQHLYKSYEPSMPPGERKDTSGIHCLSQLTRHMEEFIKHNMSEWDKASSTKPIYYTKVNICRDCQTYHPYFTYCEDEDYQTKLVNTTFRGALQQARIVAKLPDRLDNQHLQIEAYHILAEISRLNTIEQLYCILRPYKIITEFIEQTKPSITRFINQYKGPMFYPLRTDKEQTDSESSNDEDQDNTKHRQNKESQKQTDTKQTKRQETKEDKEKEEYKRKQNDVKDKNEPCHHIEGSDCMNPVTPRPTFSTRIDQVDIRRAAKYIMGTYCRHIKRYNNEKLLCKTCEPIQHAFHDNGEENETDQEFTFPFKSPCTPKHILDYISIMYTSLHYKPSSKHYKTVVSTHFSACKCFEYNPDDYVKYQLPKCIQTFWRTTVENCERCTHNQHQRSKAQMTQNLSKNISDHKPSVIFQEIIKANCQKYSEEIGFSNCQSCRNAFKSINKQITDQTDIYHIAPFQLGCLTDNVNDFITHIYLRHIHQDSREKFLRTEDVVGTNCYCFEYEAKGNNKFPMCIKQYWKHLRDTRDSNQQQIPAKKITSPPTKQARYNPLKNEEEGKDECGYGIYEEMRKIHRIQLLNDNKKKPQSTTGKQAKQKTQKQEGKDKPTFKRKNLHDPTEEEEKKDRTKKKKKEKSSLFNRMKGISYRKITLMMLLLLTIASAEIKIPEHSSVAFESILTTTINPDYTLCTRQLDTSPWTKIIENMKFLITQHKKVCDIYPNIIQQTTENIYVKKEFENPEYYKTPNSRAIYCNSIDMQLPEIKNPNGIHMSLMDDSFDMLIDAGIVVPRLPSNSYMNTDAETTMRKYPPTYRSTGHQVPPHVLDKMCWIYKDNYGHTAFNEHLTYVYEKRGNHYVLCRKWIKQLDYVVCMIPHITEPQMNKTISQPRMIQHSSSCHLQNEAMQRQVTTITNHANIFGTVAETLEETTRNHQFPGQAERLYTHQTNTQNNEQSKPHESYMKQQRMRTSENNNEGKGMYMGMNQLMMQHIRKKRGLVTLGAPLIAFGIWMVASSFWTIIANTLSTTLATANRHKTNTLQDTLDTQIIQTAQHIIDLTMDSEELRQAIYTINEEIPRIENRLNSFMDQTYVFALQTTIERLFLDARTAMDSHLTQFTFSLDAATRGNVSPYFLTDEDIKLIEIHFQETLGITVDTNRQNTIIAAYNTGNNTRLIYAFKIPNRTKEATIYKIHPIPRFINNTRVTPILEYPYIAITKHDLNFVQLTEGELAQCLHEPRMCRASLPFRRVTPGICGASEFYDQFTKCDMHISDDLSTFLYVLGNTTIYTTKEPTRAMIKCNHLNRPGAEENYLLNGTGYITLAPGCAIIIDDFQTKPPTVYSINFRDIAMTTPAVHTRMENIKLSTMEQELHDRINAPRYVYSAEPLNPHIRNNKQTTAKHARNTRTALRNLYISIIVISLLLAIASIPPAWYTIQRLWKKHTDREENKRKPTPSGDILLDNKAIMDSLLALQLPGPKVPPKPFHWTNDRTSSANTTSEHLTDTLRRPNWNQSETEEEDDEESIASQPPEMDPILTIRALENGDNTFLHNRRIASTTKD